MKLVSTAVLLCVASMTSMTFAQNIPQAGPETSKGVKGKDVPNFWVREGYRVDLAAKDFGESRFLETDGAGTIFVSQPGPGKIVALTDKDGDGVYETSKTIATGRPRTHGLCFFGGYLYFSTPTAIFRLDPKSPEQVTTIKEFNITKASDGHWWRSLLVTSDAIYTSIGDPGNINDETDTPREKIWKVPFDPAKGEAGEPTLFSTGIRNTEKLRFRPGTKEVWGCDHGSDNLGGRYGEQGGGPITDMLPPCEFNHYIEGFNYGHPFVTGLGLPRPEFAGRKDILEKVEKNTPPAWCFGAHWAPNGWTFMNVGGVVPKGDALIAFHGSWNSRRKVGYRIEHLLFDDTSGRPYGGQMLVGTLDENGANPLARPVDLLELSDGSVLWSDDSKARIYRLSKVK